MFNFVIVINWKLRILEIVHPAIMDILTHIYIIKLYSKELWTVNLAIMNNSSHLYTHVKLQYAFLNGHSNIQIYIQTRTIDNLKHYNLLQTCLIKLKQQHYNITNPVSSKSVSPISLLNSSSSFLSKTIKKSISCL